MLKNFRNNDFMVGHSVVHMIKCHRVFRALNGTVIIAWSEMLIEANFKQLLGKGDEIHSSDIHSQLEIRFLPNSPNIAATIFHSLLARFHLSFIQDFESSVRSGSSISGTVKFRLFQFSFCRFSCFIIWRW